MSGPGIQGAGHGVQARCSEDDNVFSLMVTKEPEVYTETDEQAIERIRERFDILDQMAEGTTTGAVRAMIVSGPPGVGKSFGVEKVLEQASLFDKMADRKNKLADKIESGSFKEEKNDLEDEQTI